MEYDNYSWRDRCNRYFSSLSDTEKDRDQEKHEAGQDEKSRKRSDDSPDDKHVDPEWKDLRDIKQKVRGGGKFCRYVRRVLNVVDLHGTRFAGKSNNASVTILWIFVTILAFAGTLGLVYFTVREYRLSDRIYTITDYSQSDQKLYESNGASVTICNLNLLRKDKLDNTRFSYLLNLENGVLNTDEFRVTSSVKELVTSNSNLVDMIAKYPDIGVDSIVDELSDDLEVREMMDLSNVSVEDRLIRLGMWDAVRQRIKPTTSEVENMGHLVDDMLVMCRVGQRECKQSEIKNVSDTTYGNCVTIQPEHSSEKVEIILDAQQEQYLHSVTPSVGFWVSVRHFQSTIDTEPRILAVPNTMTYMQLEKLTITNREQPCTDGYEATKCMTDCYEDHMQTLCGCRERPDTIDNICDPDDFKQYICMKAVRMLKNRGKLSCICDQSCREVQFTSRASRVTWPSYQNINRVQDYIAQRRNHMDETQIKNNILKVAVDMKPTSSETRENVHQKSILDLLAQLGGLSALVAGISAVTILELIWILFKVIVDFMQYLCKRSHDNGSLHRLTDSEITSITWAIYRQKRRMEEINKDKDKHQRKTQTTIGGNVPSRLNRRNSNGSKINDEMEQFEFRKVYSSDDNTERNNEGQKSHHPNNVIDRNGYRKYCQLQAISEEKQDDGSEKVRRHSEPPTRSDHSYPVYAYRNGFIGSSDYGYRQRPRAHAPTLPYIQPTQPPEGVRLYGGSAAYFYNSTAPTYL